MNKKVSYEIPDMSQTLAESLGIRFMQIEEGLVRASMPVDARTCRPGGILNGGASLALAETMAGYGSIPLCKEGYTPCGIQVSGNHVKMAPVGSMVEGTARLVHHGRTMHVWNVDITLADGSLVSTVRVVNLIVKQPQS